MIATLATSKTLSELSYLLSATVLLLLSHFMFLACKLTPFNYLPKFTDLVASRVKNKIGFLKKKIPFWFFLKGGAPGRFLVIL
jgi:hypothetical protein